MGFEDTRDSDPQEVFYGTFKPSKNKEESQGSIVFHMDIFKFRLVFIVTIPDEGMLQSPVYVKFLVKDGKRDGVRG